MFLSVYKTPGSCLICVTHKLGMLLSVLHPLGRQDSEDLNHLIVATDIGLL